MNICKIKLFTIFAIFSTSLLSVELDKLLKSSAKFYPEVRKSLLEYEINKFKVLKAQGAFDSKLVGNTQQRTQGYYGGDFGSLAFKRPFRFLNSEVKMGYRESNGIIPVYEEQFETLDNGETFIDFKFSLLRNALIDDDRLEILNQKIQEDIAALELLSKRVSVLRKAELAYYKYIINCEKTKVYQNLLELSNTQRDSIRIRTKRGDLAEIYLSENLQYIIKRKSKLIKSRQVQNVSKLSLELFNRDNDGEMLKINNQHCDYDFKKLIKDIPKIDVKEALAKSPQLKIFNLYINQAKNTIDLKENNALPKLDLKLSAAKDQGGGPKRFEGDENKIWLNLEIPLETRKIRADIKVAKLKRDKLKVSNRFFIDKLHNKLSQIKVKINALIKNIKNVEQEIQLATKLENAERTKFFNGDSDLILLNLREQKTVDAQLNLLDLKLELVKSYAFFKELTLDESYMKYL